MDNETRLISVEEFANDCGCSQQNISKKITKGEIIPTETDPYKIDAVKYDYIIKTLNNRPKSCI